MKLLVKDYQIVKQAKLQFKPGLTVIVGPSNNGKSSLIKAMKSAIYTESGTTPIRHGADSYVVALQNEDHSVIYQKKEGNTQYVVDGQKFSKFGLSTPEEVIEALNMKEIVLNGNKIQLNFWDQMDKPFLLDKSGGDLFKFIVDSGENDQLSSVLKSMVSDRQSLNREADTLQGSIISIEKVIKDQENILEKSEKMLSLADNIIDKKELYEEYKSLNYLVNTYKENDKEVENTQPELWLLTNDFNIYNICRYLITNKLKSMTIIRTLVKTYHSNDLDLHNERELIDLKEKKMIPFARFNIPKCKSLYDLVVRYKDINQESENVSEEILRLQRTIPSDSIKNKLSEMINLRKLVYEIKANIEVEIRNQENYVGGIERQEKDVLELKNSIKVCPLCGQKIGGEHVHRETDN